MVVFRAEGGAKLAGNCIEDIDATSVAEQILMLATEHGLHGDFVATYRDCYGSEPPRMQPFTATQSRQHTVKF